VICTLPLLLSEGAQMNIATRQMIERGIAKRVVRSAIEAGYTVSLHDGGEYTVKRSRKLSEVVGAMFTVDEERLEIRNADGGLIGTVWFVYGNDGHDAINDHTESDTMRKLLSDAVAYAEHAEFTYC
jgi:hypothetical protein